MRRLAFPLMVLASAGLIGCGAAQSAHQTTGSATTVSAPPLSEASTAVPTTVATTTSTAGVPPHFDTPEAAMTYLATAWNDNDLVSLKHVTNPAARAQLDAMHSEATNLRLDHCDRNPAGDYTCYFKHDYPPGYSVPSGAQGEAIFLVGPADTPGWYMTVFQSCG